MTAEEHKPMTTRALLEAMRTYMNDQRYSNNLNERWLADHLTPVWSAVCEVANGDLTQQNAALVKAFRAAELQEQINKRNRETLDLEKELKKLNAA